MKRDGRTYQDLGDWRGVTKNAAWQFVNRDTKPAAWLPARTDGSTKWCDVDLYILDEICAFFGAPRGGSRSTTPRMSLRRIRTPLWARLLNLSTSDPDGRLRVLSAAEATPSDEQEATDLLCTDFDREGLIAPSGRFDFSDDAANRAVVVSGTRGLVLSEDQRLGGLARHHSASPSERPDRLRVPHPNGRFPTPWMRLARCASLLSRSCISRSPRRTRQAYTGSSLFFMIVRTWIGWCRPGSLSTALAAGRRELAGGDHPQVVYVARGPEQPRGEPKDFRGDERAVSRSGQVAWLVGGVHGPEGARTPLEHAYLRVRAPDRVSAHGSCASPSSPAPAARPSPSPAAMVSPPRPPNAAEEPARRLIDVSTPFRPQKSLHVSLV